VNDISNFLLELGGFLRDYGCPYRNLINNENRLNDRSSRLQLLDFLCTEIQAAKMNKSLKRNLLTNGTDHTTNKKQYESNEARDLKLLLIALGFGRPPDGITAKEICMKVYAKVSELLKNLSPNYLGRPLLRTNMSENQWKQIHRINQILFDDYKTRRELLLKRLDVTVQSFKWADRLKDKNDEISNAFMEKRKALTVEPNVQIEDIMAAREDLCHMEKTCGTKEMASTRSKLHKILIPKVPDRGGRTTELQAPPPDMPSYQRGGSAGGGGRRGGGGHQHQYNEQRNHSNGHRGGGWSGRGGGGGDRPHSGGYQQQQYDPYTQQYDPYMQQYSHMDYQGQQQIVNEYAGMDYGGRGNRGGRGGRGGRRPY
jgi:protein FAM98B